MVLPALGWHLSWLPQSLVPRNDAMLIVGAFLAIVFAYALLTQGRQVRLFVLAGDLGDVAP